MTTEKKNSHQMRTHLQGEGKSKRDISPKKHYIRIISRSTEKRRAK